MTGFAYSLISFIIALGVLIAIHEYGHYWVAKKLGVKVLRFAIGFGKPLWKKTRGPDQTEFVLAAIPMGGYVKMLDEREGPVAEVEKHRAFNRKSVRTRFAIVAAGPLFNFLFAIVAYWLIFVLGIPGIKAITGEVLTGSVFDKAGLKAGDQIVSVDNEATPTLEAVRLALIDGVLAGANINVSVERSTGESQSLVVDLSDVGADSIDGNFLQTLGYMAKRPQIAPVIDKLQDNGAGQQAGLQSGDRIISVNGTAMESWEQWANFVRERPEQELQVIVERKGEQKTYSVTPAKIETGGTVIGRIGASPFVPEGLFDEYRAVQEFSVFAALPAAMSKTWDMSIMTLRMLWKMLVGEASIENISGPISIATYAGQSAQIGLVPFLAFMAIVSVSLGVLNLLPVPVLDGGHLVYFLVESIKGSPLSEQAQMFGQKIGVVMLGALMILALYNDINRLIG